MEVCTSQKALWNAVGDLLEGAGWIEALIDSEIATPGTAESFLKATHITRTRHSHQVSLLALHTLQRNAYEH